MKHVLALVPSLRLGGAEVQALRNCEAMLAAGYDVTLVTIFRVEGDFYAPALQALRARGLRHHALLDRPVAVDSQGVRHFLTVLARSVARLKVRYEADRPDVVYSRLWYASLVAWVTRLVSRHRPRLVFNEESRFEAHDGGIKGWLRLFLLKRAGLWLVPCQGLFDEAVALGSPVASGAVMPNIAATPAPEALAIRPTGPLALGFLGRLEPAKGLDRLLAVASALAARGRPFVLKVAGQGSQGDWLRAEINQRALSDRVALVGPVTDLAAFFANIDVLVLTSHYEGFANVIVEANAHGVPVIAMRVPHGPADIIREGLNGFLVGNGDVAGMAALIESMPRERLHAMRGACQDLAEEAYSVRSQRARWRTVLEALP